MNCIFSAISEVRDSESWLKKGVLFTLKYLLEVDKLLVDSVLDKGLSTMTISSTFHGHLACIELLAAFRASPKLQQL